ncbi:diacylglycerol kinase family protein [bacterium]|nr:diacylglycerol kinase family protein [bacterium]
MQLPQRIRVFAYALNGILVMLRSQRNAWIHALATLIVCSAGWALDVTRPEWCLLILCIMSVWTAEALNTALEFLADATSPEYHPLVGRAKDVAAGAVLITAIGSAVIGALVFAPRLAALLR